MTQPIVLLKISGSLLSTAIHYGGCKLQGASYWYSNDHDALVRYDYLPVMRRMDWEAFLNHINQQP